MSIQGGTVILARLGSTRLPGKSLLQVCGKPIIAHQIERLRQSRTSRRLLLATTTLPADEPLCRAAEACGIVVFRGSPHDVVLRMADAAQAYDLDFMAVVGGDDVFCEGELIDAAIAEYERSRADFVSVEGLPFGASPLGVSRTGVEGVLKIRADDNTDGWERYLTETGLFRVAEVRVDDPDLRHPELRLDLDYPEDFELFSAIYQRLCVPGGDLSLRSVVRLLTQQEPGLAAINRAAHDKFLQNRSQGWPPVRLRPGAAEKLLSRKQGNRI